jgi:glycosyltransferase involved in cell wall biosynthesis
MSSSQLTTLLSTVFVVSNHAEVIQHIIKSVAEVASSVCSDYEVVIVVNGSSDATCEILHQMTSSGAEPNLQVYILAGRVDDLTANWVGIENSLGDIVICLDPLHDDINLLGSLAREVVNGNDIVFTQRTFSKARRNLASTSLYRLFGRVSKFSTGIDLDSYSARFIAISRRVVNYLLQFPDPQNKFRNLASTSGFSRTSISVANSDEKRNSIRLRQSVPRGIKLVTSSTESPMRLATALSALGAFSSLLYSAYILLVWISKSDIAPGWVSLSMQQSGMFFLISLVLLVLSEYVLEISRKANAGPSYYIAKELTSSRITRKERLNVEVDYKDFSSTYQSVFKS